MTSNLFKYETTKFYGERGNGWFGDDLTRSISADGFDNINGLHRKDPFFDSCEIIKPEDMHIPYGLGLVAFIHKDSTDFPDRRLYVYTTVEAECEDHHPCICEPTAVFLIRRYCGVRDFILIETEHAEMETMASVMIFAKEVCMRVDEIDS